MEPISHLPPFSIRPRFAADLPFSKAAVTQKIRTALQQPAATCQGKVVQGFATLHIPKEDRHYWSPQLTVALEDNQDGGTHLRGMYSPAPTVWTMFVFFYSVLGLGAVFVFIIGTSNYMLGKPAPILWLVPVLLVLLASLYLVSYTGQRLGHDQMERLHRFLEQSLSTDIIAREPMP